MPAEARSGLAECAAAHAIKEAFCRVGPDGRLSSRDARLVRRSLSDLSAIDRSTVLAEPDRVLGPFDSLPGGAQRAVVEAVVSDDRWRMAAYNVGVLHAPLLRALRRVMSRPTFGYRVRQATELLAASLQMGPARVVYAVHRAGQALRAKFGRRPKLGDTVMAGGARVRDLAVCYARGVPQLPAYRGFWHDPERRTTVGLLVGLDLIENAEGFWFIESNMECGLLAERTALYEKDPFVSSLVDFSATSGYRRLIVLTGSSPLEAGMVRQLRDTAAGRSLAVTLLEDPFRPRFRNEGAVKVPEFDEAATLLVRSRHYRTNIDYVIQHKRASGRALRFYKEELGDSSFQLPRASSEPFLDPGDGDDPFPNVVFKYSERDSGEGVFFLKVDSASHARRVLAETLGSAPPRSALSRLYSRLEGEQGIYQAYVRAAMDSDRRLSKIRAYVLLTPVGSHFLSANRLVGAIPVPESLALGVIHDQRPYLVSWCPGARFEALHPEEEPRVRDAALGVARGLSWALSRGFETGPEGEA